MNDLDFFGNKIEVGDTVAFMQVKYRTLMLGVVISKSQQMIHIEHWTDSSNRYKRVSRQYYSQVIKKCSPSEATE